MEKAPLSLETVLEAREPSAMLDSRGAGEAYAVLYAIMLRLRAPDGCPWDREQTTASIRSNILEEAYELVEAIHEGEKSHIMEETGDLFMLATMVAYISEQKGDFRVVDSLRTVCEKLIRRHPHVFAPTQAESNSPRVDTPDKVVAQWNEIKEKVEGRRKKDSILDEVPHHLDPLEKAYRLQKKAAKAGFDWPDAQGVWAKIFEELEEARLAQQEGAGDDIEGEVGDLLFSVVNLSRHLGVDPALAVQRSNEKFSRRFRQVEKQMKKQNIEFGPENMERMDAFWNEAKALEKDQRV